MEKPQKMHTASTGRSYPRLKGQKRIDKQNAQQAAARLKKGYAF